MADDQDQDKTEAPSQKRIDDALEQGDVPKSPEITTGFMIGAMALIVAFVSAQGVPGLSFLGAFLDHAGTDDALTGLRHGFDVFSRGLGIVFAIAVATAIGGAALQHRVVISLSAVKPKWSNVSPFAGLQRIFGREAVVQAVKLVMKFGAVGAALVYVITKEMDHLPRLMALGPSGFFESLRHTSLTLILTVLIIQTALAAGDYLYRYFAWYQRMRMTRQEVKEEYKQQEGSPEIRQKLRQMRRDFARRGMMKKVPKATVVITNPTHFAVALQYDAGMRAPICLAKGVDVLALRIRGLADDHRIPIVEDPPLARSLYRLVEIDDEIPLDLYQPVAEIIGYVMRLRRGSGGRYRSGR